MGDSLKGEDLGRCPFCGGSIAASDDPPAVMHAMPICDRYIRLSPGDYLTAVRVARGIPDPPV
jgi:hypothetical protein